MADDDETEKLKQNFLKACGATGSLEAAKAAAKALGDEPLASVRAKNGGSALHLAAFAGQLNTAQWLVERGVPVTGVDGGGGTPLHAACFAGNLAVCGWLASALAREPPASLPLSSSSFSVESRSLIARAAVPAATGHKLPRLKQFG